MFGLEEETVVLTGRFEARHFDAALLEKLLTDTMAALCRLPAELEEVMNLLAAAYDNKGGDFVSDDGLETAGDDAYDAVSLDEPSAFASADQDELSDEELLRLQMMQDVRI